MKSDWDCSQSLSHSRRLSAGLLIFQENGLCSDWHNSITDVKRLPGHCQILGKLRVHLIRMRYAFTGDASVRRVPDCFGHVPTRASVAASPYTDHCRTGLVRAGTYYPVMHLLVGYAWLE